MGGGAYAACGLIALVTGPHGAGSASISTMANWPLQVALMTTVCLVFGTAMGIVAWLVATALGRPDMPDPLQLRD